MEIQNTESKIKKFMSKPSTQMVISALTYTVAGAALAISGYRFGKKAGVSEGKVVGYGVALNDLGITHSDVADVAAAWKESRALHDNLGSTTLTTPTLATA